MTKRLLNMKLALGKNKNHHRTPYIVRILLSIIFFASIYDTQFFHIMIPIFIYIILTLIWVMMVELFYGLIENRPWIKIFRDTLDILFITLFLYITGSTYSFLILAYLAWIVGSSMNEKKIFGIYTLILSSLCLSCLILLHYLDVLPMVSIYSDEPLPFSLAQAISSLLVLFISSLIINKYVYSIYKKLYDERRAVRNQNFEMENDLQSARKIQLRLVPNKIPSDKISTIYKPMEMIGGDFFDFIHFREEDLLGYFICDVSGHGTGAALVTSMVKMLLLQAQKIKKDPSELLYYMNDILYHEIDDSFITALYCLYNSKSNKIIYSSAGHYPPIVIDESNTIRLECERSIPLGIFSNKELPGVNKFFVNSEYQLKENDRVLLFTDGILETSRKGEDKSELFEDHLDSVISRIIESKDDNFLSKLYKELVRFRGDEQFDDDICLICFKV